MNLDDRLKQLKKITSDTGYAARSRAFILSSLQEAVPVRLTFKQFIFQNLQFGSAIAMTGLLMLLSFGGFSAWKFLSPFGLASLDPANLRAEAEAVNDIGVALNSIQYVPTLVNDDAGSASEKTASVPASHDSETPVVSALPMNDTSAGNNATSTAAMADAPSESDFSTTTVDEALDFLLK